MTEPNYQCYIRIYTWTIPVDKILTDRLKQLWPKNRWNTLFCNRWFCIGKVGKLPSNFFLKIDKLPAIHLDAGSITAGTLLENRKTREEATCQTGATQR